MISGCGKGSTTTKNNQGQNTMIEDNLDDLAKGSLYGTGEISVQDKVINNQTWKVAVAKEDEFILNYSHVIIYDNRLYTVSYNNLGNGSFCNSSYDTIVSSLNFK